MMRRSFLVMVTLAPLVAVVPTVIEQERRTGRHGSIHSKFCLRGLAARRRPAVRIYTLSSSSPIDCLAVMPAVMLPLDIIPAVMPANGNKNAGQMFVGSEHPASPATRALDARILRSFA
ncbi:hypothetical protein ATN84_22960 [Paramesorhizobium deserti]|uniref:Uncharacterized protein n=1 Tax=Paramesorhizobium deserti TaxID=1494590 RepID=A0A135HNN1_9HYPH|nr:hypothetical protein ATN84_22960 [Paramesorhizobium deserti]